VVVDRQVFLDNKIRPPCITTPNAMNSSNVSAIKTYSQEDIQQILNLALTKKNANGDLEFSHAQLVEIAEEMDIDLNTLQDAELDWAKYQTSSQQRSEFDKYRRHKLQKGFGSFVITNTFLVTINLLALGGTGFLWSVYVAGFWGLGLSLKGWSIYQLKGEEYERKFQNWISQQKIRKTIHGTIAKILPH
jgi:2TM domain